MNLRKLVIACSLLMFTSLLFAQKSSTYEFIGKVTINGKKAKGVSIKAIDNDTCFSDYQTTANGNFVFFGEASKYFILEFKKSGYLTKQLIVNTSGVEMVEDKIKKIKFNINLMKMRGVQTEDSDILNVDVIELDNTGDKFTFKSNRNMYEYMPAPAQLANNP
tara:strand:- start:3332 stop:3820 length:489 start_codon:yes stop_codon:yes gene_type:complete